MNVSCFYLVSVFHLIPVIQVNTLAFLLLMGLKQSMLTKIVCAGRQDICLKINKKVYEIIRLAVLSLSLPIRDHENYAAVLSLLGIAQSTL